MAGKKGKELGLFGIDTSKIKAAFDGYNSRLAAIEANKVSVDHVTYQDDNIANFKQFLQDLGGAF